MMSKSLSDLEIVGCNSAAAVHFWLRRSSRTPSSCPIAGLGGLQIRQKLSSLGPILVKPSVFAFDAPSPTDS